ncbi:cysteine proteinase [Agrocybe pediades]|nr:cysteine proteinase [Agrocybe pediades]
MASAQNASNRTQGEISVAEIKSKAKEGVNKEARGVSAITLIKTARSQILSAKEQEAKGDLKSAYGSYIKAATLAKMTMDSPEYQQESKGKGGVVRKELNEFLANDGRDIGARTTYVEEKLKVIEKAHSSESQQAPAPLGGSIADRMRALQNSGLSIGPSKLRETTREIPSAPTSPIVPRNLSSVTHNTGPKHDSPQISPSTSSTTPSSHTIVSPSSFGPPSPTSSTSSPPPSASILSKLELSGFNQAFPSIDELDENPAFSLPSVPTGINGLSSPKINGSGDPSQSPAASFRNFTLPIERPSSTPITPTNYDFSSRPPSPTAARPNIPHKPSGLSNGVVAAPSPKKSTIANANSVFPKDLLTYIQDHNVLLLDIRNRDAFDREHIKANAVVCIEPYILMRDGLTAESLERALVVGPRQEATLFSNRHQFDLVVIYDESSQSYGGERSPLSILTRIMYENEFKKMLKRPSMMLVGGIEAWKRTFNDNELIRGSSYMEIEKPVPTRGVSNSILTSPNLASGSSGIPNGNGVATTNGTGPVHELWQPRKLEQQNGSLGDHRPTMSLDQSAHTRMPADAGYNGIFPPNSATSLQRRPAVLRPSSGSISYTRSMNDTITSPATNVIPLPNGSPVPSNTPISYPQFPRRISPNASGSNNSNNPFTALPPTQYDIASPPQASINPSLSRRRSDFVDQSQEALSGYNASTHNNARPPPIDYPELLSSSSPTTTIIRPPPVAASSTLVERQDNRPRVQQATATSPFSPGGGPKPPRIQSDYPVPYWADLQIGTSGLKNLGNTCYMNAPIQCLSATVPFSRFFTEGRWRNAVNYTNPLGSKGQLTGAFAKLLHEMWGGDLPYLTPIEFRKNICQLKSQYNGTEQHDSQEFLSFLIDGIHEDLNRIIAKPNYTRTPEEEAELERLPQQIASDREWRAWRARNDSLIVDFFQGQFRNRLQCLTCQKTSTTYNVFSILSLPIPHGRSGKVPIERCLDAFFNEEILEKDDAWDCPQCKTKRRASKKLSLARLPPVLMIHLKRFEANGRFSDKIDTFVDFPMKNLDLTNYMPPPLPPGVDKSQLNGGMPMSLDDPQTQLPPYRYELYGVTNHYGNLTGGHYTAFVASRGGWMYCDDSSVKPVDSKQVVGQKAYVLFYKRVRS